MQRKVLESLVARGAIIGLILPETGHSLAEIESLGDALSPEHPFFIIDCGTRIVPQTTSYSTDQLFLSAPPVSSLLSQSPGTEHRRAVETGLLSAGIEAKDSDVRQFVRNLCEYQKDCPYIFLLLPRNWNDTLSRLREACDLTIVFDGDSAAPDFLSELEASAPFADRSVWWISRRYPDRRTYPKLSRALRPFAKLKLPAEADFFSDAPKAAEAVRSLLKIRILSQNPLEGFRLHFNRLWWIPCIALCALPFVAPLHPDAEPSMLREMRPDRNHFSNAPYISFIFNGGEPLQRIARYAAGRYTATVTDKDMLQTYVQEVLRKNDYPATSWLKEDSLNYPPDGTELHFAPPEKINNAAYDSLAPAWRYFTGIFSDSIAYITEWYHAKATPEQRLHLGIDVASRMGARILAPFSGKAWTKTDERGGVIIGISHGKYVMLFMHCDELLYLDGQDVMQGDPLATIGVTGHTTGPHVHLVTGIADPHGDKLLGTTRYRIVNPITWYYLYTQKYDKRN